MSLMARLLIVASLLGVVTFFIPAAYHTSPFQAIRDGDVWRLAVPFLVPFALVIFRSTLMSGRAFTPMLRRAAYSWAIATLLVTATIYFPVSQSFGAASSTSEWLILFIPIAVFLIEAVIWLRTRRDATRTAMRPFLALRMAYLPNACCCLYGFLDDHPNVGIWMIAFTTIIYAIDVARGGERTSTPA